MQVNPLAQGFGAEIAGFDVQVGRGPGDIAALRQAYDRHHLLVFRDCGRIAPERQVEIARWFGVVSADNDGAGHAWTVLRNDEASGRERLPFHSDITYCEFPIEGISLHPQALPRAATSTTFVSNARAWASLSEALKDDLRGRKARHYYESSRMMDFDWPILEYWHPVCLTHPRTGAPLLFVTEHHADRIEGMDEAAGAARLQQLFEVLYAPEGRYEHVWREGDLVIWDNLAIQHARTRAADPSEGARVLQRVSIGEHTFTEQLDRVRQRQGATVP